jgi:alpha-1,2-mannosyltransferase
VSELVARQRIERLTTVPTSFSGGQSRLGGPGRSALGPVWLGARGILASVIVAFFVWQSFYDHAADFKTFFSAGYAVRHPEVPLYDLVALDDNPFGEVFKLAPPAAVYLVPFSFGTVQQARLLWRIVLVVAMLAAFAILAQLLGVRPLGRWWLAGLALWSIFGPLQIAVGEGQWDPIFLLLIAVATYAVAEGRITIAALAVAVAASIKPYPLVLVGYFVARRAWRSAAVTVATLATLLLLGALVVGLDETTAFVTRVLPASGATTAYADNQSLGGVVARAWASDLKPFPLRDAAPVDLAIRGSALALVGATIWVTARRPATDRLQRSLQLSLFVPLSILVIPAAWTHYQAILLVPLTLLAVDQARNRARDPLGWLLLLAIYLVLLLPNPTMLYGPEIDRGLWLRSRADAANLALQRLYPTPFSRLILSYKAFAVSLLYGLLVWRVSRPASRGAHVSAASSKLAVPAGAPS